MIEIRANIDPLVRRFADLSRQMPFAISKALNVTANQIQQAERQRVEGIFTLRRRDFILNTIKINPEDRATKAKLVATVRVDPTRDFLAKFEQGGIKRPRSGGSLALPFAVQPNRQQVIPQSKRPRAFQFELHRTKAGKIQFKGQQRTFIVERGVFSRGILQRVGRGASSRVILLYWFRQGVQLPANLAFEATARRVVKANWDRNLADAVNFAIRTAR